MNNRDFFIVIIVFITTSIISYLFYMPTRFEAASEIKISTFPKTIGEWNSKDISFPDRVYELLETKNLIMRNYKDQRGNTVSLYIIYSQNNRKISHPPEICLQGGGAIVTNKSPIQLTNAIRATKLVIEKKTNQALVIYWYKAGKFNTNNYLKQQLRVVIDRMLGKNTPVALVRVMMDVEDNKPEFTLSKIKAFCALIEPLLDKYVF